MRVSATVLVVIAYASSTSSALPIANGSNSKLQNKRQIAISLAPGMALVSPGMVLPGGTLPGAIQIGAVPNTAPSPITGFPAIATSISVPPAVVVPVSSSTPPLPTSGFMLPGNNNNAITEPSKPGGISPGSRSPLASTPGRKGTQGQQLKEDVLTDPTLQLTAEKRKFIEEVPDTIWDQIALQPPGSFEKALDDLVFENRMPNTLTPLLAAAL